MYSISTAVYAWFRIIVQYNKLSLFFANWHVLSEFILLLNILEGERVSEKAYDYILVVWWLMSVIIVYIPLTPVLYFMQLFGFVTDNMLVWIQYYAYYETKLPFYIWGVVGAIVHVIMLTIGILDPLTGDNGIGLAIAGMLLVPMMYCYTMFVVLYVQNWRENHFLPYLHLGADDDHLHHFQGVSDYHPAFHDLYWGCPLDGDSLVKEKGKTIPGKDSQITPAPNTPVANTIQVPETVQMTSSAPNTLSPINTNHLPPMLQYHISQASPRNGGGANPGLNPVDLATVATVTAHAVAAAHGVGLLYMPKKEVVDRSRGLLAPIIVHRRAVWLLGIFNAIIWLLALLAALGQL